MRLAPLALLFVALLPGAAARADDVEPPPASCPAGSTPRSSHAGPTCRPTGDCTDDSTCAAGEHCGEIRQCVETRGCGGRREDPSCTVEHVLGDCTATCAGSATCRARRVCLSGTGSTPSSAPATGPAPASAPASSDVAASGCSARGVDRAFGGIAALALSLALVGAIRARRRRS